MLCPPATESMLATKQNIENEIRETKRQITALRPLGAQLDSCRGAVRRATSRRDAAIAQVHAAQVAVSEADAELARLQAELSELELRAVEQPAVHGQPTNSLEHLEAGMTSVINDLSFSAAVDDITTQSVHAQMSSLFPFAAKAFTSCPGAAG